MRDDLPGLTRREIDHQTVWALETIDVEGRLETPLQAQHGCAIVHLVDGEAIDAIGLPLP